MGESILKDFSMDMHSRLKNTVDAGVKCKVNESEDRLYIEINRLGLVYKTFIENISNIATDEKKVEYEFDKVIKKYRSFVNHKFFY